MDIDTTLTGIRELLAEATGPGAAWYTVAVAVVVISIRLARRPAVQQTLPEWLRWRAFPRPLRVAIVFANAVGASWIASVIAGQSLWSALLAAIGVGCTAIAGHEVSKRIGYGDTSAKLRQYGSTYEPGSIRTALETIVPIDWKKIRRLRNYVDAREAAKRRAEETERRYDERVRRSQGDEG